jgi:hypothetical protein
MESISGSRIEMRNLIAGLFLAGAAAVAFTPVLQAQAMPNSSAAKPPAASVPAPDHDLSGVWNMRATPTQRKYINSTWSADGPEMTAWAKERYEATKPSNGPRTHSLKETDDPVLKSCLPPGVPRIYLQPFPMEIVQTPKETLLLYEYDHTVRRIFTDGRKHPDDVTPTYMGDSIGNWDGDTFVVDTIGFNDKTWLDRDGHGHSDQLQVIERFHRADRDNMQVDITMEDPKALVKPWISQVFFQLKPTWDISELVCTDNAAFLDFEK